MRQIEDDCVGCPQGCMGRWCCPLAHAEHIYCDKCGEEVGYEGLYNYNGEELCEDCFLELAEKKPASEFPEGTFCDECGDEFSDTDTVYIDEDGERWLCAYCYKKKYVDWEVPL